jgi:RimJ/RimL family protein N-acetyltransferase
MKSQPHLRNVLETDLPTFFADQADPEASSMAAFTPRNAHDFLSHWTHYILPKDSITKQTITIDGLVTGNILCWEESGKRFVGYWISKKYWGRGIASQALREFLNQINFRPIYAHVVKNNVASTRVLEKCGFMLSAQEKDELLMELKL